MFPVTVGGGQLIYLFFCNWTFLTLFEIIQSVADFCDVRVYLETLVLNHAKHLLSQSELIPFELTITFLKGT